MNYLERERFVSGHRQTLMNLEIQSNPQNNVTIIEERAAAERLTATNVSYGYSDWLTWRRVKGKHY